MFLFFSQPAIPKLQLLLLKNQKSGMCELEAANIFFFSKVKTAGQKMPAILL